MYQSNPDNALILEKWDGDNTDRNLIGLAQLLHEIKDSGLEDVRDVLTYYRQFKDPIAAFRYITFTFLYIFISIFLTILSFHAFFFFFQIIKIIFPDPNSILIRIREILASWIRIRKICGSTGQNINKKLQEKINSQTSKPNNSIKEIIQIS